MRRTVLALVIALAACGQQQPEPPPEEVSMRVPPPWFICDGIDAPALFVFERSNNDVRVAEYGRPDGAIVQRQSYFIAGEQGAAGSVLFDLVRDFGPDGAIRQLNPGMLENPGSAYTLPFASVRLDGRDINCRWMPRTRVLGFTGRRSFVVYEDQSGDLIYTSYNFADAANARSVELTENGRTTTPFSVEVRNGTEAQTPQALAYTFETQGFRYVVTLNRDGTGTLDVSKDGVALQSEPLVGYQQGTAPAQ
ncbi:MAG: hypothetical protein ACREH4_00885 [Vitreimonas sp.]